MVVETAVAAEEVLSTMESNGLPLSWVALPALLYLVIVTTLARLGLLPVHWQTAATIGGVMSAPGLLHLVEIVIQRLKR